MEVDGEPPSSTPPPPHAEDAKPDGDAAPEAAAGQEEPKPAAEEPAPAPPNPLIGTLNEQWKKVQESPSDFTAWTNLITTAEKLDDLERLRGVYDAFLPAYPLCFGYWRKYAEAENRHGSADKAAEVYARGVEATPYSIDLWRDYAAFRKANGAVVEELRQIYDRALAYNSSEYGNATLWDKLVQLEEEMGDPQHVVAAYGRALAHPLKDLGRLSSGLKAYAANRTLHELLTPEQLTTWTEHVKQAKAQAVEDADKAVEAAKEAAAKAREAATQPPPEGLDAEVAAAAAAAAAGAAAEADAAVTAAEAAAEAAKADTSVTDEELKASWLASFDQVYEASKALAEWRRPFEEAAKRNWWHVKPLDAAQLANWARYLELAGRQQAPESLPATQTLYERCLVPCANYPEFWERYVRWLEAHGKPDEADAAVQRCTGLFCKQRAEAWLLAARHAELRGRPADARAHFKHVLEDLAPQLLTALAAYANFERRQGNLAAACAVWEGALSKQREKLQPPAAEDAVAVADGTKDRSADAGSSKVEAAKLFAFISIQSATFFKEVAGNMPRAREVLRDALSLVPTSRHLLEAAIHLELSAGGPGAWTRAAPLFECACAEPPAAAGGAGSAADGEAAAGDGTVRGLPEKDREELSARSVEVADAHGTLAEAWAAEAAHATRFPVPPTFSTSGSGAAGGGGDTAANGVAAGGVLAARKRGPSEEFYGAGAYGVKAPRQDVAASPHAPYAAAATAHHHHAGYGTHTQSGWGPGYGPGGGYGQGGYGQGGYGGGYSGYW